MKSPAKKSYREGGGGRAWRWLRKTAQHSSSVTLGAEEKEGGSRPEGEAAAAGRAVVQEGNRLQPHPRVQPICSLLLRSACARCARKLGKETLTAVAAFPRPLAAADVRVPPKPDAVRHRRVHALRALALQVKRPSEPLKWRLRKSLEPADLTLSQPGPVGERASSSVRPDTGQSSMSMCVLMLPLAPASM